MRIVNFLFVLMLAVGLAFGSAYVFGTATVQAEEQAEPGSEMENEAAGDEEEAVEENTADADTAEDEMPGGEMEDDAAQ